MSSLLELLPSSQLNTWIQQRSSCHYVAYMSCLQDLILLGRCEIVNTAVKISYLITYFLDQSWLKQRCTCSMNRLIYTGNYNDVREYFGSQIVYMCCCSYHLRNFLAPQRMDLILFCAIQIIIGGNKKFAIVDKP